MFEMADPPHPGEILREEFIKPLNLTITYTSKKLGITRRILSDIINEKAGISPAMSCKLAKAFGTEKEHFYLLQVQYDLAKAIKETNLDKVEVIYKAS